MIVGQAAAATTAEGAATVAAEEGLSRTSFPAPGVADNGDATVALLLLAVLVLTVMLFCLIVALLAVMFTSAMLLLATDRPSDPTSFRESSIVAADGERAKTEDDALAVEMILRCFPP